jgi:hypothetical protein
MRDAARASEADGAGPNGHGRQATTFVFSSLHPCRTQNCNSEAIDNKTK